ncbi:MAG TPA: DMT family transporter [Alphaproteobacteria bacterium]|nr:DMT family transporter [Alphaproteobacteria bacterium]
MTQPPDGRAVITAALWMGGALASFSGMAVAARELSADMSTFEILFFRSFVGLLILLPIFLRNRGAGLRSHRPSLQVVRNSIHFSAQYGWVAAVAVLPLAEAFALEFTMPIWATLLAVFALNERMTTPRYIAVIGGFAGVLVILRPGFAAFNPAVLYMLVAALGFATSVIITKVLIRKDSPLTIIFYMSAVQLPLGLVPALFDWTPPTLTHLPWLVVVGVGGLTAHFTLARALNLADATIVLPMDFLRVPLIALIGAAFYAERLVIWVIVGAAIIFGANYYMVWRESRRR